MATLKQPEPLHAVLSELEIHPGDPRTDLGKVREFWVKRGRQPLALAAAPVVLAEALRQARNVPAMVHGTRGAEGHFFSVRDYRAEDDTVQVLDPPSPPDRRPVHEVARASGGVVLFVDSEAVQQAGEIVRREKLVSLAKYCGLSLASGLGVLVVYTSIRRSAHWRSRQR